MASIKNLTQYEWLGINNKYNLADGHAHQGLSQSQMSILDQLSEIWRDAELHKQKNIEEDFKKVFFRLAGQRSMYNYNYSLLSYSASVSIEVVANFLKMHNLAISLLHPTFDNISAIMHRMDVSLECLEEDQLRNSNLEHYLESLKAPALFFVYPNNPTGYLLRKTEFETVVNHCKQTKKLLIIDFCFRFFSHEMLWDQYYILQQANIDFITIEDTGKTWPTLDLKVGITTCNPRIYADMLDLHNNILLNVSPFILRLVQKYIEDSQQQGIISSVIDILETNRRCLRNALRETFLLPVTSGNISVEWIYINSTTITSIELWAKLRDCGIYVLPGTYFYWQQPDRGNRYIRIALMRPPAMFSEATLALRDALLAISSSCSRLL